jgi:hypothetical protein
MYAAIDGVAKIPCEGLGRGVLSTATFWEIYYLDSFTIGQRD